MRMVSQQGFTLIEVMVGFLLVVTLFLTLNSFWVMAFQQFDGLTLRQQAVFRLNGEMERLNRLYTRGDEKFEESSGYEEESFAGSGLYLNEPDERWVYKDRVDNNFFGTFTSTASSGDLNKIYSSVYSDATGASRRNYVWLDRTHSVVGRISWELFKNDSGPLSNSCCQLLTLFLDFPFRATIGTDKASIVVAPIAGLPVETLTVQTIVGQR